MKHWKDENVKLKNIIKERELNSRKIKQAVKKVRVAQLLLEEYLREIKD